MPTIEEQLNQQVNKFPVIQQQTAGGSKADRGSVVFCGHCGSCGTHRLSGLSGPGWLERYLTWLLKDIGNILKDEGRISLNANFKTTEDKTTEDKYRPQAPKEIVIRAKSEPKIGTARDFVQKAQGIGEKVLAVLEVLGFDDSSIKQLAKDVPDEGILEGDFRVFIKKGHRKEEFSTDTVDYALRNIDSEDLEIIGKGGTLSGGLFKLSEEVSVKSTGSWLDSQDAIQQIKGQMELWANEGKINL